MMMIRLIVILMKMINNFDVYIVDRYKFKHNSYNHIYNDSNND